MKKKVLFILLAMAMLLVGCTSEKPATTEPTETEEKTESNSSETEKEPEKKSLKVGTFSSSGIAAEAGVSTLEEMGYEIEVIYFDDAVLPNVALQEGSIDFNMFQHTPYLEAYMENNHGVDLTMAELIYYPNYGLYSSKYETLDDLPEGAKIGLYSDASNVDRGLRILDSYGLIKLTDEEKDIYNELDIVENPKNFTFELVGFGTAVRAMEDLDASMAASSHILAADLDPTAALALEERDKANADFTCGIAVRTEDLETVWLEDVIKAYTSDASAQYMNENYKGASVPVFN
ncbi:MAG: MetQ/NlpA family ABC transporter substrate-binding protein [Tissierellia bacterium]|nr:MetQ/NlpA family ABC transporter substrate-binding protein [Tissierellia bacterium]MDD4781738.1 MetQ/NlpA family ABC transporter substrate-binding protein [Tissierellia bacterium]